MIVTNGRTKQWLVRAGCIALVTGHRMWGFPLNPYSSKDTASQYGIEENWIIYSSISSAVIYTRYIKAEHCGASVINMLQPSNPCNMLVLRVTISNRLKYSLPPPPPPPPPPPHTILSMHTCTPQKVLHG